MQSFVSVSLLYKRVHAIKIKIPMKHVIYHILIWHQSKQMIQCIKVYVIQKDVFLCQVQIACLSYHCCSKNERVQYVEYIFLTLHQISGRQKGETLEATTCNNMVNKSHLSNESMKCFKYNLKFKPIWSINYGTSSKKWIEPYPKIWTCFHIWKHRLTLWFKNLKIYGPSSMVWRPYLWHP